MKIGTFASAAAFAALGLAAWTSLKAQGPLYDRVDVNLPYSITIGDKTLQPGEYVIQQLRSASGDSKVLLIYSDNGMKFETSAMTIPALDPNTARDTKVILHHIGNDYYFDKIWIQGKDYGYEFPLPNSVKEREREQMQPVSVAANYSSVPESATTTQQTTVATNRQTTPPAATTQQTQPATTQQQTSAAEQPQTSAAQQPQTAAQQPQTMAQSTMPQNTVAENSSANREEPANTPSSMPHTSAGWLMMLLSGGALSGAGMSLRRKR